MSSKFHPVAITLRSSVLDCFLCKTGEFFLNKKNSNNANLFHVFVVHCFRILIFRSLILRRSCIFPFSFPIRQNYWMVIAIVNPLQGEENGNIGTAQKTMFFIKDFFSKCDQIRRKLLNWSQLLEKSLMKNFIFCAV